jgi:collagenase-like PrtC family protease
MPYGMIVNGTLTELRDDVQYLLSPQDLMAVDYVPELIKAGVQSFKIEGRLKGPEYVAITTKTYRQAVDEAWTLLQSNQEDLFKGPSEEMRQDLKQTFARGQDGLYDGLSEGFLMGSKHQSLVRGRSPRNRGLYIGKVLSVTSKGLQSIVVDLEGPIKRGDGVVFDRNQPENEEEGGSVYDIFDVVTGKKIEKAEEIRIGKVQLTFGKNSIDYSRIKKGDLVWRNKDALLEKKLKSESFKPVLPKIPVAVTVSGSKGTALQISITSQGDEGKAETSTVLQEASKRPISLEDLNSAIGTLGDTPFVNTNIDISSLEEGLFIPVAQIKEARRLAVEKLIEARRKHGKDVGVVEESLIATMRQQAAQTASNNHQNKNENSMKPSLSVLCRTPAQVRAACSIEWLDEIIVDFLEIQGLRECVEEVKKAGKIVVVATPRIIKPDEYKLFSFYVRLRPDALLVRSAGFLQQLLELGGPGASYDNSCIIPKLYGDSFLNTANAFSAKLFLSVGLSRLAPSPDLNVNQICELAKILGSSDKEAAANIECVLHQHLPIFHTEHCVFARFLSSGDNHLNCGHPCERSHVSLRDMDGRDHLVIADQGCRNTVFNAKSQSGASYVNNLLEAGIRKYRIELVDEPAEYVYDILEKYRNILITPNNSEEISSLLEYLEVIPNKYGLSQGSGHGSLAPTVERERGSLKKTAYQ